MTFPLPAYQPVDTNEAPIEHWQLEDLERDRKLSFVEVVKIASEDFGSLLRLNEDYVT